MAFWDRGKIRVNNVDVRNIDDSETPIVVRNAVGDKKYEVDKDGAIKVGTDVVLERSAANTWRIPTGDSLNIADDGGLQFGGVVMAATVAEINRAADVSTRLIAGGAALTLTYAAHDGKTILLDTAAGTTITLPASTGGGGRFRFQVSVTATTNNHIIKVANASDIIQGVIFALGDDATSLQGWEAGATADTITFNRTTTGTAAVGHFVEIEDVLLNKFAVHGLIAQSGAEATPFSATV